VVERVGGGGRPQAVRPDFKAELAGICPDNLINAVGGDAFVQPVCVVADRTE